MNPHMLVSPLVWTNTDELPADIEETEIHFWGYSYPERISLLKELKQQNSLIKVNSFQCINIHLR